MSRIVWEMAYKCVAYWMASCIDYFVEYPFFWKQVRTVRALPLSWKTSLLQVYPRSIDILLSNELKIFRSHCSVGKPCWKAVFRVRKSDVAFSMTAFKTQDWSWYFCVVLSRPLSLIISSGSLLPHRNVVTQLNPPSTALITFASVSHRSDLPTALVLNRIEITARYSHKKHHDRSTTKLLLYTAHRCR